jgi:hypothetical protein
LAALFLLVLGSAAGMAQVESVEGDLPVDASTRVAIIDTVITKLNQLYVYPDIAEKMTLHLRSQLEDRSYEEITSLSEFVQRLTEDLLSVYPDGHLEVQVLREQREDSGELSEDWWDQYVSDAQYKNFGVERVKRLPGNIGYLDLQGFYYPSVSGPTVTAAMNLLGHSDALIVDLRKNPGGRGELSQIIFSYLFEDHRVHYSTSQDRPKGITKQWWTVPYVTGRRIPDAPVYVLTSYGTGSAAEEFAYTLKHLGRAIVVGDTTAGAAHTTHRHEFPDLQFVLNLPDGTNISPVTGTDWEGKGVFPDVVVPPETAVDVAYGLALDTLLAEATGEQQRFRLDWVKRAHDAKLHPVTLRERELRQYTGEYGSRLIRLEKGALIYQRVNRPAYQLIALGDDLFRLDGLDFFRIHFVRGAEGRVTELVGLYDDGGRDPSPRTR